MAIAPRIIVKASIKIENHFFLNISPPTESWVINHRFYLVRTSSRHGVLKVEVAPLLTCWLKPFSFINSKSCVSNSLGFLTKTFNQEINRITNRNR